jgi:multidrug efflux pump subunit AcrA (membrane-fusion protein)
MADRSRRDRAVEELQYCVIHADRSGMVIHPNAAKWENGPIAEGTNVHKDQVLLLMPDLEKMQVKIGVHESSVKRVKVGQIAEVRLGDRVVTGEVAEVASITKPAGWWTGNQVRYDTLIKLPIAENQLPGMSAEVEITVAEYPDVLQIPVAAVVESASGDYCWVKTLQGPKRVKIDLGDSNDIYHVVEFGLDEGDEVYINPYAFETLTEQVESSSESASVEMTEQTKDQTDGDSATENQLAKDNDASSSKRSKATSKK